jgi:hypothetical protein
MDVSEQKIEQRFLDYESLQARHLDMMKRTNLPDMKALTQERKQASDDLQTALNRFMENAGSLGRSKSIPLLSKFESRLNTIMELDERIASEIERHRGVMKKELSQMKQGKKAIEGYGSAATPQKGRPRVFSISR